MEKNIFRDNGNECSSECEVRQHFEEANLPGPTPEQVCNALAAAMLARGEKVIEGCPLEQITRNL